MSSPPAAGTGGLVGALQRIPAKAWLRMGVLVAILGAGFVLVRFTALGDYLTREHMIATLEQLRASPWFGVLLMLFYVVFGVFSVPVTPLVAGGGVVFGPLFGSLYNILGLVLGAMAAFYFGKYLGRDFIVHLAGPRLRRAERMFERRGFWPLVQTRFLPIPFSLVSYGAALAGVRAMRFLVTSTLGLIPATVMHTYFIATLILEPSARTGALYLVCWGTFAAVTGWPTLREALRRRQRYREIRERRRGRSGGTS